MLNKTKKMKIGNKEYKFKMTNRTVFKVDEKYGNYAYVINGIMEGTQLYNNALKLLSMCCIDEEIEEINGEKIAKTKEFTTDELIEKLTPKQIQTELVDFASDLCLDYIGVERVKEDKEKNKKDKKEEKN